MSRVRKIGMGPRLGASFCLVILLGIAGYFQTVRTLSHSLEHSRRTLETINTGIALAKDVSLASRETSADTLQYVYTTDESYKEFKYQADEDAGLKFAGLRGTVAQLPQGRGLCEAVADAQRQFDTVCDPLEDRAMKLADAKQPTLAQSIFETKYTPARFLLEIDMERLVSALNEYRTRSTRQEAAATRSAIQVGWAAQAAVVVISLLIGVSMSRATAASLMQVVRAQETLARSETRFRALVQNASDGISILDAQGQVTYLSPAAEKLRGFRTEALAGKDGLDSVHPEDRARAEATLSQALENPGTNIISEMRLSHAQKGWIHCELIINNLLHDPGVQGVLITYRDISERRTFEHQLQHQAFHDSLTDLPNRALFMDRLSQAQARAGRQGSAVAVLFLDLDNFKVINDSLGHSAGDELLRIVARRLAACARPGDTVARLGGDEFTLLLENLAAVSDAVPIAERVTQTLQAPIALPGHQVFVTASIGIAASAQESDEADGLLRDADVAMYEAKNSGKAHHVLFEHSMSLMAMERLEMETDLRRALDDSELRVHYQPIIALDTGHVTELEALVRWEHPRLGMIAPGKFIPVAEETGLIVPLGRWVLREACRQGRVWQDEQYQQKPITLCVNLSVKQLQQDDLVEEVAGVLAETGFPASSLKLEITESVMMLNADATIERLYALRALGVRLAVDDFGTGYSSMAYLSRLPIDTLKIDRAFVQRLGQQTEDDAIVRAIITLAKTLNLSVTSEGIETSEQLAQLQLLGCDRGQGYLYARPLSSDAAHAYLIAAHLSAEQTLPALAVA